MKFLAGVMLILMPLDLIHCAPKRSQESSRWGYTAGVGLNLGLEAGYKDGIAVLGTKNHFGFDVGGFKESSSNDDEYPEYARPSQNYGSTYDERPPMPYRRPRPQNGYGMQYPMYNPMPYYQPPLQYYYIPQNIPQYNPQYTPQNALPNNQQYTPQNTPPNNQQYTPQNIPPNNQQYIPQNTPPNNQQYTPQNIPPNNQQYTPQNISPNNQQIPISGPNGAPNEPIARPGPPQNEEGLH